MVGFGVDIKGLIFRFSVRPIFSSVKVEGGVKEVGLDKVGFGGDLEVVLLKYFDDFLFYFVYVWPTCVPYHGQAIVAVQAQICDRLHKLCSWYRPTNSQISAPSKDPIVTSKRLPPFLTQTWFCSNSTDFLLTLGFTTTTNCLNTPRNAMQPSYPRLSGKKKTVDCPRKSHGKLQSKPLPT